MYSTTINQKEMKPETLAFVKKMGKIAYPNYNGRKFYVRYASSYHMENYWSEGSRTYSVAVNFATMQISAAGAGTNNPFNASAHAEFEIPVGFGIIENSIFMGKRSGITLVIRKDEVKVPGMIPAPEKVFQIDSDLEYPVTDIDVDEDDRMDHDFPGRD